MNAINNYQTLIIALAVGLGLLLGQIAAFKLYAEYLIVPFLMVMLFGLFLNIPLKNLLSSFSNLKFISANLVINFVWTPIIAYLLGLLLLKEHLSLWIGFVMLMVTPCTDWYLIFTGIAKGNTSLAAAVLPVNLILQLILLPVYLLLFFGRTGSVDPAILWESILLVLLVPFLLAQLIKFWSSKRRKKALMEKKILPFFETAQIIFLALAIVAMFASQGEYLTNNLSVLYILLVPILIFFIVNFLVSRFGSYLLKFNYEDSASLSLTTLARNSPIALAIALTAFPDDPLISLVLVIGPLLELPILALVSQVLLRIRNGRNNLS
ncbi:arsenic resistance protein [Antarcticibacterium arcticum]|uniref:Arsenic resistance protein n=1 Tax=Antarcticibacterium arcticum TaxID=2585771 RepID=A0A5B8YK25_9FLAO|nr:bile acid:sodium symporter [Antarcticibacterium arcticum]QED37187.1 arsenic resistance protein [Antarcticibacterium arcticum]